MSRTYRRKNMSGTNAWCSDASYLQRKTTKKLDHLRDWMRGAGQPYSDFESEEECRLFMIRFHSDSCDLWDMGIPSYTRTRYSRSYRRAISRDIRLGMRYDDWDGRIVGKRTYGDDDTFWYYW